MAAAARVNTTANFMGGLERTTKYFATAFHAITAKPERTIQGAQQHNTDKNA